MKSAREILIVGGDPALDLINTVDARRDRWGPDALASFADLVLWAVRIDVVGEADGDLLVARAIKRPLEASQALRRATDVRELLYKIFLAEARGDLPDPSDVARLSEHLADAMALRTLAVQDGAIVWRDGPLDFDAIRRRVLLAAGKLAIDRERRRIRECTGRNCGWLFLDTSKSGKRRWCSEASCGMQERVRRFRSKRSL